MILGKIHKMISGIFAMCSLWVLVLITTTTAFPQSRLPDLVVSRAEMKREGSGQMAESLSVTVLNRCTGAAGPSYVLATFKQSPAPDAKPIYFTGHAVKALRGGESITNIFDLKGKNVAFGTFVLIEADPYKKVAEGDESNNWRTLFPTGFAADQEQCSAKL
jgi:CARDB